MMPKAARWAPPSFAVLRTPLLPVDAVFEWSADSSSGAASALDRDRIEVRGRLREWIAKPEIEEALFIASPTLAESIDHWKTSPDSPRGRKIELSLLRYLLRMSGRATPFGLFAANSVISIGNSTSLQVAPRRECRKHTRLDMDYACALANKLAEAPTHRLQLAYWPNTSMYSMGDQLRYVETTLTGELRSHQLSAIESSPYIAAVLAAAERGATIAELVAQLQRFDSSLEPDECVAFLDELIGSQLLDSELPPPITGPQPLATIEAIVRARLNDVSVADTLAATRRTLEEFDADGIGVAVARYRSLFASLAALPAAVNPQTTLQVDLYRPAPGAQVGASVVAELERAVDVLHRLFVPFNDARFRSFRERFYARYADREVRLVEALDAGNGIGFQSGDSRSSNEAPTLATLNLASAERPTTRWTDRDALLLRMVQDASARGATEIVLTDAIIERLTTNPLPPLPSALCVFATVAASSAEAVDRGDFQLVVSQANGPSGANLLGRFCHGDASLHRRVEEHLRAEEQLVPDAVFAEVVHLPEQRVGNVLARPQLRGYEIAYHGRSGAPPEKQIAIDDLWISICNGKLRLRSQRLQREIIPRLTTAHAFFNSGLPLYEFLCFLARQDLASDLLWWWGPLNGMRFLPRVRSGRAILTLARWLFERDELPALAPDDERAFAGVQRWREQHRVPRWVALADGDNVLPVDLGRMSGIDLFLHYAKERPRVVLRELFPAPRDALAANAEEGRFAHELLVPLVAREERRSAATSAPSARATDRRSFAPGSEWLYAKVYCGPSVVSKVLQQAIAPLVSEMRDAGVSDRWFFIRYGDPDWHLRVRFHGDPAGLAAVLLPALHRHLEPFVRDGRVWRVCLDTYDREVERYGGFQGIELAEEIFQADSEAVLSLLDHPVEDGWRLSLLGVDRLLRQFVPDPKARKTVTHTLRTQFKAEFSLDNARERALGTRFRRERAAIEQILTHRDESWNVVHHVLAARQSRLEHPIVALGEKWAARAIDLPLEHLVGSYVHMHVNRILPSEARPQELVIYDFLDRLGDTELHLGGTR
jgi:thiopeptide-type bacteriocin biosynthesis protein